MEYSHNRAAKSRAPCSLSNRTNAGDVAETGPDCQRHTRCGQQGKQCALQAAIRPAPPSPKTTASRLARTASPGQVFLDSEKSSRRPFYAAMAGSSESVVDVPLPHAAVHARRRRISTSGVRIRRFASAKRRPSNRRGDISHRRRRLDGNPSFAPMAAAGHSLRGHRLDPIATERLPRRH